MWNKEIIINGSIMLEWIQIMIVKYGKWTVTNEENNISQYE